MYPFDLFLKKFQPDKSISTEEKKTEDEDVKKKEKDRKNAEIAALKQELENVRKKHEDQKEASRKSQLDLEKKLKEAENRLAEAKVNFEELEANSRSKIQMWTNKEHIYKTLTEFQLGALKVILCVTNQCIDFICHTFSCISNTSFVSGIKI